MTDLPETNQSPQEQAFEPVIIGFTCNWCSYRAADMAGISRMKYAPNVRLIRLMCSGRLDPTFVLKPLPAVRMVCSYPAATQAIAITRHRTTRPCGVST